MIIGGDKSNFQMPWDPAYSRALRAAGHSWSMQGRQRRNVQAADMAAWDLGAGILPIGEYLESLGGEWPELFPLTRVVSIAAEAGSEFTTEGDIDNAIAWVRSQGRQPAVYSSYEQFRALGLLGVTKWAAQGVWCHNAKYDEVADGFLLPRPYGGWTVCQIDQFSGAGRVGGVPYELDLDAFEPGAWAQLVPSGADIRDGQDVGLNRLDLEGAGLAIRDADAGLVAARIALARATDQLVTAHRRNGGDGDLIRGK